MKAENAKDGKFNPNFLFGLAFEPF